MTGSMEKFNKAVQAFLEENASEDMSDEQINELLQEFMNRYNATPQKQVTPDNAETAEDYMELAEEASTKKAMLAYARKALELDPDNLDAARTVAELSAKDDLALLESFDQAAAHGADIMTARGYMDEENIGSFWGMVETRPYMRLLYSRMEVLTRLAMMRRAAGACEEMLRLCTNDNLGVRYRLIHLYAFLEEEEAALAVWQRFEQSNEAQFLLPLSAMYFKLGQMDKALEYLRRLVNCNRDTKKFFRAMRQHKIEQYLDGMNAGVYQPFTIQELIVAMGGNHYLYSAMGEYFVWADKQLIAKRK